MTISFGGLGEAVATFYNCSTNAADIKDCVKMSGSGEVCACSPGDSFIGVCISADNEFAGVQVGGYITMPYTGPAPIPGPGTLAYAGSGAVKADAAGTDVTVFEVDTALETVGFML